MPKISPISATCLNMPSLRQSLEYFSTELFAMFLAVQMQPSARYPPSGKSGPLVMEQPSMFYKREFYSKGYSY